MLQVRDLQVAFGRGPALVRVLNGVSLSLRSGELCGLVGESGSGKTVLALSILRLLPQDAAIRGSIRLGGEDLLTASAARLRALRGAVVSMILQDPMTALNPLLTVECQVGEPLTYHCGLRGHLRREQVVALLEKVRLPGARQLLHAYPHQLSGGTRQRVAAAAAIAGGARLLIADEPTTALDASTQADFVRLLHRLARETGMAVLFISHDLHLVLELVKRVVVLYAGHILEDGPAADALRSPKHPYTQALAACVPTLERRGERLPTVGGTPADPARLLPGCPFAPRCPEVAPACSMMPPLVEAETGHSVRCWLRLARR